METSVLRRHAAEQDINDALRRQLPARREGVEVLRAEISLHVSKDTADAASHLEQVKREGELDALARRQAKARMEFLYNEMLGTPAKARLYTLLEHSPRLEALPPGTDPEALVRQVQQWHPEGRWVVIAQLLHTFVERLSKEGEEELLFLAEKLLHSFGERKLAEQVKQVGTK
ncbi:hypothetical protein ABTY53_18595 [Streptomyces noursei]|uniref:hypothetical protein n=1 Tax=Streptomyces noursei TaxID=1971 RepID=UPI0033249DB6